MLDQHPGPHWFSAEMLKNPTLLEMAGRVKMDTENVLLLSECFALCTDGTFPKITMKVTLRDSSVLEKDYRYPEGDIPAIPTTGPRLSGTSVLAPG